MLTLEEIKLRNFLSHASSDLSFKENQKLLIDGISGAGKSTIVDGIIWCLYGKGRSDNRSLIKKGCKSGGVLVVLRDGNKRYKIERSITSSGKHSVEVSMTEDGEEIFAPIKVTGVKAIQDHIEKEILHSSYLLFINSAAYPQDNTENFIKQTAEKRKDIILEIIRAGDYDEYYEKAKDYIRTKGSEGQGLQIELREKEAFRIDNEQLVKSKPILLAELKTALTELESANERLKKLHEDQLKDDEYRRKIMATDGQIQKNLQAIGFHEKTLLKIADDLRSISSIDVASLKEYVDRLNVCREELAKIEVVRLASAEWQEKANEILRTMPSDALIKLQEDEVKAVNQEIIAAMEEPEVVCPAGDKCPFMSTSERDKKIEALTRKLEVKTKTKEKWDALLIENKAALEKLGPKPVFSLADFTSFSKEVEKLKPFETQYLLAEQSAARIAQLNSEREKLTQEIETLKIDVANLEEEKLELQSKVDINIATYVRATENKLRELSVIKASLEQEIKNIERVEVRYNEAVIRIGEITQLLYSIGEDVKAVEEVKVAFGNNGIKSIVVDYVLPQLEDKINEVLSKMSDFTIRIETQKDNAKGDSLIDGLFLTVRNGQGETFDLANYSGGEKMKINTAISEGLASLQKIGFRILDESVTGLDTSTVESFLEVLGSIQSRFNQLICISHLQPVKDVFPEKVLVAKQNGTSIIKTGV